MAALEAEGESGDWLDDTKAYIRGARLDKKEEVWNVLFSKDKNETEEWGLTKYRNIMSGWN